MEIAHCFVAGAGLMGHGIAQVLASAGRTVDLYEPDPARAEAGKDRIARQRELDLGIAFGETTRDGVFTLEWANCIGMCDQGPALLVNERVYPRVTPANVREILAECRAIFGSQAHQLREELHS